MKRLRANRRQLIDLAIVAVCAVVWIVAGWVLVEWVF